MIKPLQFLLIIALFSASAFGQNFTFPLSGDAVNNQLSTLTAADGVTLVTTIRSEGCIPGTGSRFRYGTDHVSTGAIYRNTDWAANCSQSKDIIKLDFSTSVPRPFGLKFSIYDVDNGSDSVSVLMYQAGVPLPYSYLLYSPTFVTAYGLPTSFGFVGSGGNNAVQDDNRGRIDIILNDINASVDSVIVTKYNNRNAVGNPSQTLRHQFYSTATNVFFECRHLCLILPVKGR